MEAKLPAASPQDPATEPTQAQVQRGLLSQTILLAQAPLQQAEASLQQAEASLQSQEEVFGRYLEAELS